MDYLAHSTSSASSHVAETRSYRVFMLSVALVVALCLTGIFFSMAAMNRTIVHNELISRARTDINTINTMRKWNAKYGGVFIEKKLGDETNPYLKNADIVTIDGKTYTKKHPSLMTREISELLKIKDGYSFHITSLKPINPGNIADPKEVEALHGFERGEAERSWYEEQAGKKYFRYMAPLKVDELCLKCHADQGYKLGDIRGGISVQFNIDMVEKEIKHNTTTITVAAVMTLAMLLGAIFYFFNQLVRKLAEARRQLKDHATTDALTGVYNRRSLMHQFEQEVARAERFSRSLSCIMLDLDYFKSVNDQFGHHIGDEILISISSLIKTQLRQYDIFGRYGGEEFLIVLPDTNLETALSTADRLRQLATKEVALPSGTPQTLSFGVAAYHPKETIGSIIQRADEALYRAKSSGRNRVEAETPHQQP